MKNFEAKEGVRLLYNPFLPWYNSGEEKSMIEENVKSLLKEIAGGNACGEKVTLVAATKTRTAEEIQRAIDAGISDVGENRVQEFREKHGKFSGAREHFIGRLQLNKVKYLVGKVALIQSVDRYELAEEIAKRAESLHTVQEILLEVNAGGEETKGGFAPEESMEAFRKIKELAGLRPVGFMAMLPATEDEKLLSPLCDRMRSLFDAAKKEDTHVRYLSMGMSGDWRLCLGHGANMIRLGTAIFGKR